MVDIIVSIALLILFGAFALAAVRLNMNASRYKQRYDEIMENELSVRSHGSIK